MTRLYNFYFETLRLGEPISTLLFWATIILGITIFVGILLGIGKIFK